MSLFKCESSLRQKATKIFNSVFRGNQTVKMEDMTISIKNTTIMALKFTFNLNLQIQVLLNLCIHVTDIWWLTNCRDFWWCKKNSLAQYALALVKKKT